MDEPLEVKTELVPCYVEGERENGYMNFEDVVTPPAAPVDYNNQFLWTSKATNSLISHYKKYRSMVGQTTQIRSLRDMFEMISLEMQNSGYHFSPQKCENKWRVLERKYKNLLLRERLKKPGKIKHYRHWEHKKALDEIFNEGNRLTESNDNESPSAGDIRNTIESSVSMDNQSKDKGPCVTNNCSQVNFNEDNHNGFRKLLVQFNKNLEIAELNKERRHKEKMSLRREEIEIQKRFVQLKEQQLEMQKAQMFGGAHYLNMKM